MRESIGRFIVGLILVTGVSAGTGLAAALVAPGVAGADQTFTVNDVGDYGVSGGLGGGTITCTSTHNVGEAETPTCTLRAAIEASDNLGQPTTIVLPDPTLATLVPGSAYVLDDELNQLLISDSGGAITINGAGQDVVTIEAATTGGTATTRVLKVNTGDSAIISGVTIQNGVSANTGEPAGGILDCGDLTLSNSTVQDNTANYAGGGIELSSGGNATLNDDSINNNQVTTAVEQGGGGIAVDNDTGSGTSNLTLNDTSVTDNDVQSDGGFDASGGGIDVFGQEEGGDANLTIDIVNGSSISGNTIGTTVEEEQVAPAQEEEGDAYGAGISLEDGLLTATDSTITDNTPDEDTYLYGGGAEVDDQISGQTVASFTNDTITSNDAYDGGALELDEGSTTVIDTNLSGNTVAESGAGVYVDTGDQSVTTIDSSTISDNTMPEPVGESPFFGDGGGLTSAGCNSIVLTDDTITGNSAWSGGGGYYGDECFPETDGPNQPSVAQRSHGIESHALAENSGSTAFLFDTITDNSAGDANGGGNIQQEDASTITIGETIMAGGIVASSPTTNCEINTDDGATFTSLGYNLIDDTTCGTPGTGDIIGQDPQLGALGANGGPTQTQLPATGSPAIGGVPSSVCSGTGVTTDQRGNARGTGVNGTCTIGSVEVAGPPAFNPNGYRLVADEGGIFDFGLNFDGSLANNHLNAPIIGIANAPGYDGYV
ncbi:MAG TPA: choice-of-anchor Q domain-containing protein, partial [Acidimicrobiales bacterium]